MAKKPRNMLRYVITKPSEFFIEDGLCAFQAKVDGEDAWILLSPSVATRMVGLIQKRLSGAVFPWPKEPE